MARLRGMCVGRHVTCLLSRCVVAGMRPAYLVCVMAGMWPAYLSICVVAGMWPAYLVMRGGWHVALPT